MSNDVLRQLVDRFDQGLKHEFAASPIENRELGRLVHQQLGVARNQVAVGAADTEMHGLGLVVQHGAQLAVGDDAEQVNDRGFGDDLDMHRVEIGRAHV